MKNMPLCRFCGQPMEIARFDHYDTWYSCSCDGYKKYQKLQHTVLELKSKLCDAEEELYKHKKSSLYQTKLASLEAKKRAVLDAYYDEW